MSSSPASSSPRIFNTSRLVGLNVLVTGASGGIGEATARLFAKAGSNVIITARRLEQLNEVKLQTERENVTGQVLVQRLDMTDSNAIDQFIDSLPTTWKPIDVLVNNAGLVFGRDQVGELNFDEVNTMLNTNVLGLFRLTNSVVKHMKSNGRGHIINLGSIAGREAYSGGSIYCATKHAVHAFSGALLRELVDTPIRVTEIQPGMVETEFSVTRFRGDRKAADSVYQGLQPLVAQDVAEEIVWCASRPPHVQIAELFVLPTSQASSTIAHRQSTV